MSVTVSGGLVSVAGDASRATEEIPVAEFVSQSRPTTDEPAGWDPYEVWRTRVKGVRDTRSKTASSDCPT